VHDKLSTFLSVDVLSVLLLALIKRTFREQTIVFIQTKKEAHRMHIVLGLLGVRVGELHGSLSQAQVWRKNCVLCLYIPACWYYQKVEMCAKCWQKQKVVQAWCVSGIFIYAKMLNAVLSPFYW